MLLPLLDSVTEHFADVEDPRRTTANLRHEFVDILMIALCAVLGGANHWTTVATFGRAKETWFRTFLRLPNGIPSHDTFSDVFAKIEPEQFERCFIEWVPPLVSDGVKARLFAAIRQSLCAAVTSAHRPCSLLMISGHRSAHHACGAK